MLITVGNVTKTNVKNVFFKGFFKMVNVFVNLMKIKIQINVYL